MSIIGVMKGDARSLVSSSYVLCQFGMTRHPMYTISKVGGFEPLLDIVFECCYIKTQ